MFLRSNKADSKTCSRWWTSGYGFVDPDFVDPDKVGVGVDPEDASNIILVYLAEKENKLLEVKQVYY